MSLRIFNTLSRKIEPFEPIEPGHVRMYVCGMTVYDLCHLGHARSMIAFDVVYKWLKTVGYRVTYVRNVTDIDDKIIRRALERGESIQSLTNRMICELHADADALGIDRPTHEPRATEFVKPMQSLIHRLLDRNLAYQALNGDVNYAVRGFTSYGKLSGKSVDDLRAGQRVEVDAAKRDPLDFVLWKSAKPEEPVEAKWSSPWGEGRPGWHIECSAMSCELLGASFDIHGGGADLQFPHHENEIAQSEGAFDQTMARYWMHNGFVNVDNEKMSKSLGNFFTIRDVLKKYDAEVIRFFILRTHYRSALNYSDAHLEDAKSALRRLYTALAQVLPGSLPVIDIDWANPFAARFRGAMNDDFATPEAVACLFELANSVNKSKSTEEAALLKALANILGLLREEPKNHLRSGVTLDEHAIEALIEQRLDAKKAKNFGLADKIRLELLDQGIVLKDGPAGTTWVAAD